jgi:hypothetical protein
MKYVLTLTFQQLELGVIAVLCGGYRLLYLFTKLLKACRALGSYAVYTSHIDYDTC